MSKFLWSGSLLLLTTHRTLTTRQEPTVSLLNAECSPKVLLLDMQGHLSRQCKRCTVVCIGKASCFMLKFYSIRAKEAKIKTKIQEKEVRNSHLKRTPKTDSYLRVVYSPLISLNSPFYLMLHYIRTYFCYSCHR